MEHEQKPYYPPKTAGHLMTARIPVVSVSARVSDVEELLLEKTDDFDTINYIYATKNDGTLAGIFSIKELFRSSKDAPVQSLFRLPLVSARVHTEQERVARLAIRHNIKAVPVVDKDDRFLGVIQSDVILSVLQDEHVADALRSVGVNTPEGRAASLMTASAGTHIRKRLPWLIVGLCGGVLAASVVGFFEGALAENLLLVAFIPMIVYMADAVGGQAQTLFIRSAAIDHSMSMRRYVAREAAVDLALAALLGLAVFGASFIFASLRPIGTILGISIFGTIIAATSVAVFLPWLFMKLKYDPAIASGPFATVVRDIMSLLIYFSVAAWLG